MLCPVVLLVVAVGSDVVIPTSAANREGPSRRGGMRLYKAQTLGGLATASEVCTAGFLIPSASLLGDRA